MRSIDLFFCVRLGSKMRKQFEKSLTSTFSSADLFLSLSSLQFVLPSLPPSKVPIGNFGGFIVVVLRTELRIEAKMRSDHFKTAKNYVEKPR